MNIVHSISALQSILDKHRQQKADAKIALVPTMGNLHEGHLALVGIAKACADFVVVSIFVNPTQFGVGEDFDSYPRTLTQDCNKLQAVGVDMVFAPSVDEMYLVYPPNVQVLSGDITKILCGQSRPTHFDGVGLVVSKLFNIIRPDVAVFGKKDYQQLAIIRQLVCELNFGVEIVGGEIVRADDGLALSSRNQYLTADERAIAPRLYQRLNELARALKSAQFTDFDKLAATCQERLKSDGFVVDYLQLLNQNLQNPTPQDRHLVILTASHLGRARLLDNVELVLDY